VTHRTHQLIAAPPVSSFQLNTFHTNHTFKVIIMAKEKVCLAYSGGLDTSCILKWLLGESSDFRRKTMF